MRLHFRPPQRRCAPPHCEVVPLAAMLPSRTQPHLCCQNAATTLPAVRMLCLAPLSLAPVAVLLAPAAPGKGGNSAAGIRTSGQPPGLLCQSSSTRAPLPGLSPTSSVGGATTKLPRRWRCYLLRLVLGYRLLLSPPPTSQGYLPYQPPPNHPDEAIAKAVDLSYLVTADRQPWARLRRQLP